MARLKMAILIERYLGRFESNLTVTQSQGLSTLTALSDNDLLDLNLARQTLAQADLHRDDVREVLCMLRKPLERQENEII